VFLAISDTAQISFGEINSLSQLEDWFNENKPEAKHLWYTTERLFSLRNRFENECDF
jgi:hypothetical protein